ncbi:DeoR/GlpR family DNA-binding transcription regulator [Roseobacter sp. YSTF-M11]|uniref:DeoR/GlpR family DNA-binding transcription regulator n=1 Tax=Roseobacter insulae TaxID=2859783 RepID=A0A9X1FYS3_9RHOB|nr:DeoR/GlpR family DNA-binding transcription regulator [Roseobacter insulae]MBW4710214.1 DeoR/GlpR family DNA-binding transcription regulator [Roseobacter insulae]
MGLNIPDTRQRNLQQRLAAGAHIVAAEIAEEFGISIDTARRDLIALERAGQAHRVRGGAVPILHPAEPMQEKILACKTPPRAMVHAALDVVAGCKTLILDGGSTVLALARALQPAADLLVVTPSPWAALACLQNGVEVHMLGGRLSARGGINVGAECEEQLAGIAAEVAVIGVCGLDDEFGVSSDDCGEARVKKAMAQAATRRLVLADAQKIGTRARHRTLVPAAVSHLITDAMPRACDGFRAQGIEITHV